MTILAIDPGTTESAWVLLYEGKPYEHGKEPNAELLERLRHWDGERPALAIEMIASYGMPVGREVFDTCLWVGRFQEAWQSRGGSAQLVYHKDVKLFHCQSARANDASIRQALIDRYGPGREVAIGTSKHPGPLHGIKGDEWAALAVALVAEGKPHAPLFAVPATNVPREAEGVPF